MDRIGADPGDEMRPAALGSGLVVELDRQRARAVLFGSVEGQGRLIAASSAPSTTLPPIDDASVAVKQVIRALEEQTGQMLLGPDGVQIPSYDDIGAQYLAVTGQPTAPVRLTLIATGDSPIATALLAAARRAIVVIDTPGADARTSDGVISGTLLEQRIRAFRPDTVVLVEGATADAEWSTVTGTLASLLSDGVLNQIIIVAGEQRQQGAATLFGEGTDLRGIDPSEFATAEIASALEAELNELYEARLDARNAVQATVQPRFVNLIRAGDLVTRFIARRRRQTVVSTSIGDGALVQRATADGSQTIVRPEFDLTHNIRTALNLDARVVARWLPFALSAEDFAHWTLNRALRPFSVADSARDVAIERAIAVAWLRELLGGVENAEAGAIDLIIGGRTFADWREPALGVLALLDAFQPAPASGMVEVVLDVDGILPAAGAIGDQSPALAADAVELDLLQATARVIVVTGSGSEGDLAVRGQLRPAVGEPVRFTVPYGSIHHLTLPAGQEATLTLSCEPRFAIGVHASSEEVVFGRETPLRGSELGIIIDARGRPLQPATDAALQTARVANWFEDLGAQR